MTYAVFCCDFECVKYNFIADIKKATLQIELHGKARDVKRFLWLKDLSSGLQPKNIIVYRFKRVAFTVISGLFLPIVTVSCHLEKEAFEALNDGKQKAEWLLKLKRQIMSTVLL
ncbi:unnamed protein product [Enterobius vermicularis]|uniref:Retrovirus-related Pol polyprotein from transposon TNT 1-94 n=1 Tax=Enterobius vermicularis TaxID=51028 RepID=A0A0N4VEH4_ENTVE|nr:unnamed protein product [Enterobius vermicularis]